jgi:uncharacterized protein YdaU (DUF1376 family)
MNYYSRHIGDYAKKAGRLSLLEHGVYTILMDAIYDREQFPTEDEAIDWVWARTDEEIDAVKFVLRKFFTLNDGVYVQNRIKEELSTYQETCEKNARIAKEREEKRKQVKPTVHESSPEKHDPCTSGDQACTTRHLTNNQEPITNNQYKDTNVSFEGDKGESGDSPTQNTQIAVEATSAKQKNNKARPKDLQEVISYMLEQGSTAQEANRFFDYFSANGWLVGKAKAPMRDWQAACRNWMKNNFNRSEHMSGNTYDHQGNVVQMTNTPPVRNQQPQSKQGQAIAMLQSMKSSNRGTI